ncbi:hypothetical protein SDC9_187115 [bioreactor metagenome]|uniref:Uncharacterized protein n=1 Tax=bioreactor metagenome TaxID=1076179 RepID=A0A645HKS5_9ZZZZ
MSKTVRSKERTALNEILAQLTSEERINAEFGSSKYPEAFISLSLYFPLSRPETAGEKMI